jgi:galactitol-specific phosphotransferase system IIB component
MKRLRQIIREEVKKIMSESRLERAISGLRVSNVTERPNGVDIVVSDGRTSKVVSIKGNPEINIEQI